MLPEIEIKEPKVNPEERKYTSFTYIVGGGENRIEIPEMLTGMKVSPYSHPNAIDLFAGDGSGARILVDLGWKVRNILCVDLYIPRFPLVNDVEWKFWDLLSLSQSIRYGKPEIPASVLRFRGQFDIVLCLNYEYSLSETRPLSGFFKGTDGVEVIF